MIGLVIMIVTMAALFAGLVLRGTKLLYLATVGLAVSAIIDVAAINRIVTSEVVRYNVENIEWYVPVLCIVVAGVAGFFAWSYPANNASRF